MINKIWVYTSDRVDVYENLAIEKYLFDNVDKESIVLYLWQNKSAVVVGRNQNVIAECDMAFAEKEKVAIARRASGGGAVYHDLGNLNFTFISHKDNYDLGKNFRVIVDACGMAGINVQISGRNDIVAGDKKFSGNAFYQSGEKAYHHGTIMINTDTEKMQRLLTPSFEKLASKGIESVKSRVINLSELSPSLTTQKMKQYLVEAFENIYRMKVSLICRIDISLIFNQAKHLSSWDYIYAKAPYYSFSVKEYFTWGNIEVMLEIKKGYIKSIRAFTDSMRWEFSNLLEDCLTDCEFLYDTVSLRLSLVFDKNTAEDLLGLLFQTKVQSI